MHCSLQARKEAQSARRRQLFEQLFEKWDNDGSGFLDFDELMSVISKFKENMEAKVIKKGEIKCTCFMNVGYQLV